MMLKKIVLFPALIIMLLMLSACGQKTISQSSQPSPEPEAQAERPVYTIVKDFKISHLSSYEGFLNETLGYTVGSHGEIHYTLDGGQTWPRSENTSHCRFGLEVVSEQIAWTCGNRSQTRMTKDGGKTWQAVTDFRTTGTQGQISFIDDVTGWVASDKKLGLTKDGGQTWTDMKLPEGETGIASIYLRTAEEGFLLTPNGKLYKTNDIGTTWEKIGALDFTKYGISDMKGNSGILHVGQLPNAEIAFTDGSNGTLVIIGYIEKEGLKTFLLETSDGGTTWSQASLGLPEGYHAASVFLSRNNQYITFSSNAKRILVLKRAQ